MSIRLTPPPATPGAWLPEDHGLVAWTADFTPTATVAPTNGTLYLVGLQVRRPVASGVRRGVVHVTAAAVGATASQNWMGLYNSSGALLGSAADVATASTSSGPLAATLGTFGLSTGLHWLAVLLNAGTPASLARMSSATAIANLGNLNLTASTLRWATAGTSLTAMPSSITPASFTATGNTFWGALS